MGEAKRRKKLDPAWGQPHWKQEMNAEQYREWAFHDLGKDSIICFSNFDESFFDEIPPWVKNKAPLWIEQIKNKRDYLLAVMFDDLHQNFFSLLADELSVKYKLSQETMYFEVLKGLIIASHFVYIEPDWEEEEEEEEEQKDPRFVSISYEELQEAETRFINRQQDLAQRSVR